MKLVSLFASAIVLLAGGPAYSATVLQSQSFSLFHVLNHTAPVATYYPDDEIFGATEQQTLRFQGFDPGLGTLKSVSLTLTSNIDLGYGLFIANFGASGLEGDARSDVRVAGVPISQLSLDVGVGCGTRGDGGGCLATDRTQTAFEVASAVTDLASFTNGAPVDVDLISTFDLLLDTFVLFGDLRATATQSWVGTVTMAYDYDAPPSGVVPEPGTWALMIVGFGLVGSSLRRRRIRIDAARHPPRA